MAYDSRPATLLHIQRVGELMVEVLKEALDRSTCHDRSKTEPPEVEVFDEFTPKLRRALMAPTSTRATSMRWARV
jgi:Family of unknown function (DUF5662)